MISMNPMVLPGESMSRFYAPPQSGPFNSSNAASFMNMPGPNPSLEDNNNSTSAKNTPKSSRSTPQNSMSIVTNQPQLNRPGININQSMPGTNPPMLSPSQQQQLFNSHQQILNSGFSPAVIAAATSALTSNNPQLSHLIQHQLHMQQQQLSHLQMFQAQMHQPGMSMAGKHESSGGSSIKKGMYFFECIITHLS